jgi:hypothetical protein
MRQYLGAALMVLVSATVACKGPAVPHPLSNQFRYTCCNLHYEKPDISDVNYQQGTLLPAGTRVQIMEVRGNKVTFAPVGHPPITLVLKYGDKQITMDQYLAREFLEQDPRAKLAAPAPAPAGRKGGKGQATAKPATAPNVRSAIEQGYAEAGMTKEEVLMALGYPPAHRTPSLDSAAWTYWQNRWRTFVVYFDGDKVVRVQR